MICSYRSSQGTWTGGQAGSESPPHPEKASLGRRWIGCKPKIKPYFRPRQPPMPDLICPNVEFDQFRVYFIGTTHLVSNCILVVVSGVTGEPPQEMSTGACNKSTVRDMKTWNVTFVATDQIPNRTRMGPLLSVFCP